MQYSGIILTVLSGALLCSAQLDVHYSATDACRVSWSDFGALKYVTDFFKM